MYRKFTRAALIGLVILTVGWWLPVHAMQAGSSRVALELPDGVPLAGHVYRQGRSSTMTLDPVYARCLYIDDDQFDIALVNLDTWGITPELRARILELLPEGLDPEAVIITATGNYSGPGGLARAWDLRQYYGRYMPEMIDSIANGAVAAIEQAMFSSTRATIGYRIGNQDSLTVNSVDAEGPRDREIGVVRVDDSDGDPIAILGVLSAAARTLGPEHGLALSAEFSGVFCNELESLSSEGTVAIFLNGASGDQVIARQEGRSGPALMNYVGKELAVVVKGIANTITCEELPVSVNHVLAQPPRVVEKPYVDDRVILQTVEFGNLLISFVPGAASIDAKRTISREASRRGYGGHILVGPANDHLGALGPVGETPDETTLRFEDTDWISQSVFDMMRRGANR